MSVEPFKSFDYEFNSDLYSMTYLFDQVRMGHSFDTGVDYTEYHESKDENQYYYNFFGTKC